MGLIVPHPRQSIWHQNLQATPGTSVGTGPGNQLTANATIHTKGNYTQLISATTYDSYGFWATFSGSTATGAASCMLCDIAIGADTAEVVIVPNIQCGWRGILSNGVWPMFFPIFIPKGTRIAARTQALISADLVNLLITCNQGPDNTWPVFAGCDVYGVDTANSRGTLHTPGNTGAESADANVGSTTSRAYGAVSLEVGGGALTTMNALGYHWELTDGTNTICEWATCDNANEYIAFFNPPAPFYRGIPASTQLMIQAECSGTAQQHDVQFRCFY